MRIVHDYSEAVLGAVQINTALLHVATALVTDGCTVLSPYVFQGVPYRTHRVDPRTLLVSVGQRHDLISTGGSDGDLPILTGEGRSHDQREVRQDSGKGRITIRRRAVLASMERILDREVEATVGTDRQCLNCGRHVTLRFARVLGDNENRVHGCPHCYGFRELSDGEAASSDGRPGSASRE